MVFYVAKFYLKQHSVQNRNAYTAQLVCLTLRRKFLNTGAEDKNKIAKKVV